jgi:hypothetical protein
MLLFFFGAGQQYASFSNRLLDVSSIIGRTAIPHCKIDQVNEYYALGLAKETPDFSASELYFSMND